MITKKFKDILDQYDIISFNNLNETAIIDRIDQNNINIKL